MLPGPCSGTRLVRPGNCSVGGLGMACDLRWFLL